MALEEENISVVIAEDHDVTRLGLKLGLESTGKFSVVGEATNGQQAIDTTLALHPQVVLMDVGLPVINGIEATRSIKDSDPNIRVIIFTTHDSDRAIFDALAAGADGYCLKNAPIDQLSLAIKTVSTGAAWLDPGIAGRVLRSQSKATEAASGSTATLYSANPRQPVEKLDNATTGQTDLVSGSIFSDLERRILAQIEHGSSYQQISNQLDIPIATVQQSLCRILETLVAKATEEENPLQSQTSLTANDQTGELPRDDSPALRAHPKSPLKGVIDNKYEIESILGAGGMCTIYKATHKTIGKPVAIKILHEHLCQDQTSVKRFQIEARAASTLDHPRIVRVYDLGTTDDERPYLVMDFIEGANLQSLLNSEGYLSPKRAIEIFLQVCEGLAAAHERQIIHRDVKPGNIMIISNTEKGDLVKLIDFGIAKVMEASGMAADKLTLPGEVMGSVTYMSPEQCLGQELDQRSDIYSLGCTMYESLTGVPVFGGKSPLEIFSKHVNEMPARFARVCEHQIPFKLEALTFKLLDKHPERRLQTVMEVHQELSRLLA